VALAPTGATTSIWAGYGTGGRASRASVSASSATVGQGVRVPSPGGSISFPGGRSRWSAMVAQKWSKLT
jgi:hypothetical protein